MTELHLGRPAADGVALGPLRRVDRPWSTTDTGATSAPPTRDGGAAALGSAAVDAAFAAVAADLAALAAELRAAGNREPADIVETTALIAEDPDLRAAVAAGIAAGAVAGDAIAAAVEQQALLLEQLADPTLAARAADVRAVGRRLLRRLRPGSGVEAPAGRAAKAEPCAGTAAAPEGIAELFVVAAHEVTADDLLTAGPGLAGAVSVLGGANGHAAIVARSLGVPLVLGLDPGVLDGADGVEVLVDGMAGTLLVAPSPAERAAGLAAIAAARDARAALAAQRELPTRTAAGVFITVLANVGSVAEADAAVRAGAPGVGLLRTEMPFLAATHPPTRHEHLAALTPVLGRFAGRPVTVRTLDFAADKLPPFLRGAAAPPADLLPVQLEAILEAAAATGADVRIMLPMVIDAAELRAVRALLDRPVPVGAMVETRGAVERIEAIAAEADFLSIGTNDLTSALLGLNRRDPALTPARATDPVVLKAIATVVAAADIAGTPLSVCGDAAADPVAAPALIALGCTTLSVAPAMLDRVRALVRAS